MDKRIFVSIDLPREIKDYLASLVKSDIYWIKWTPPRNLHITLNFLGDLSPARITSAREILQDVSQSYQKFTLQLSDLSVSQDMLWLVPQSSESLADLQDELNTRLKNARLGKRERKSYVPHVLLAKSKTARNMKQVIENFKPVEFLVDRINLYESELTPGAATHTLIQSFTLGL